MKNGNRKFSRENDSPNFVFEFTRISHIFPNSEFSYKNDIRSVYAVYARSCFHPYRLPPRRFSKLKRLHPKPKSEKKGGWISTSAAGARSIPFLPAAARTPTDSVSEPNPPSPLFPLSSRRRPAGSGARGRRPQIQFLPNSRRRRRFHGEFPPQFPLAAAGPAHFLRIRVPDFALTPVVSG